MYICRHTNKHTGVQTCACYELMLHTSCRKKQAEEKQLPLSQAHHGIVFQSRHGAKEQWTTSFATLKKWIAASTMLGSLTRVGNNTWQCLSAFLRAAKPTTSSATHSNVVGVSSRPIGLAAGSHLLDSNLGRKRLCQHLACNHQRHHRNCAHSSGQ